ncbi:hypothetical protein PYH37_001673 [Sinorhizobium numidicum]|uniref:Uncharacterized protein n=1 Tax=Sinorhizobium numidicum TaxID=680248 RepID=A0ABY8CU68_9HYPH|nr:hypothetical protein [Sinorhizobium numidicum]WEX74277.1 hypothetical protein PYH37_001673 [Sinorhizobium numidicum]WEX80263.1 hypothetical protein PYH38_001674 [Sinorhizobium numidicum]
MALDLAQNSLMQRQRLLLSVFLFGRMIVGNGGILADNLARSLPISIHGDSPRAGSSGISMTMNAVEIDSPAWTPAREASFSQ